MVGKALGRAGQFSCGFAGVSIQDGFSDCPGAISGLCEFVCKEGETQPGGSRLLLWSLGGPAHREAWCCYQLYTPLPCFL